MQNFQSSVFLDYIIKVLGTKNTFRVPQLVPIKVEEKGSLEKQEAGIYIGNLINNNVFTLCPRRPLPQALMKV